MTTLPTEIPSNIVLLTAPQLLGVMFNWALWGILTVQVYLYQLYFNDPKKVQALVYTLYLLECIQTLLCTADILRWFSYGYGRLDVLSTPFLNPIDLPIMAGIIATFVQLYFTWRIRILSGSLPLAVFIGAVSVGQGIAGIVAGIMGLRKHNLIAMSSLVAPKIWLVGAALSDTMIAITMTYFLYRARKRTKFPKTHYLLKRIISLTLETNSLSAGVAILTLILFIKFPDNTLFLCPPYALGKLYSNTLLVIFNNRIVFPHDRDPDNHASIDLGNLSFPTQAHTNYHLREESGIRITVLRQTDKDPDMESQQSHKEAISETKRPSLDVDH